MFLCGVPSLFAAPARPPLAELHFPSRVHQFVWRNWEIAALDRMARVLRARERDVLAIGAAMGLERKPRLSADQLRRIYITVIHHNWHLLPERQLIELLGWTREKYLFTLKEDDFLDVKLGAKPDCEEVLYRPPSPAERAAARAIAEVVRPILKAAAGEPAEELFQFVRSFSGPAAPPPPVAAGKSVWTPRYLYSYLSLYGDPLLERDIDPLPDKYLEGLARAGVNGVWMQAVLNTLAPSAIFPEFGDRSGERLAGLNRLIGRAAAFGVRIYLYLNEPRSMPAEFFEKRPGMRGTPFGGAYSVCTSVPEVRQWIGDSIAHVFSEAPGLGGMFSITMSENHTNCFSHSGPWGTRMPEAQQCPRCSRRDGAEVIGELIGTFRDGVRRASASADVIAWDWGWPTALSQALIPRLPRDVQLLSVSEWDQPLHRGGVDAKVREYSLSVPGPGPRASANWRLARENGIRAMAKVQFNNTWEISAVPFVPVPQLVLRHAGGLARAGVSGVMLSWTCGGYPSPNLEAAAAYYSEPRPAHAEILRAVAARRYGEAAAPGAVRAWDAFSAAFSEYPYGVAVYKIPTQHGPANLLRARPTGWRAGMILMPQDDYRAWLGVYPPEAVLAQFRKMAKMWDEGLALYEAALSPAAAASTRAASLDLAVARTCGNHFHSTANQLEFYMARTSLERAPAAGRAPLLARMRALAADEQAIAARQFRVARAHSEIAFEASNHYYYTPLDLLEKVLNCRQVTRDLAEH